MYVLTIAGCNDIIQLNASNQKYEVPQIILSMFPEIQKIKKIVEKVEGFLSGKKLLKLIK